METKNLECRKATFGFPLATSPPRIIAKGNESSIKQKKIRITSVPPLQNATEAEELVILLFVTFCYTTLAFI